MSALALPGRTSDYASSPDSVPLSITGDIDLQIKMALSGATSGATANLHLVRKFSTGVGQRSYILGIAPSAGVWYPFIGWTSDGTTLLTSMSTVGINPFGGASWIRATLDVDNGAGGRTGKFYTSTDGETWSLLSTVVTAGTTSIFDGTEILRIGTFNYGASGAMPIGNVYRVRILNGYDGAGSVVYDANFEKQPPGTVSFADDAGGAAVTFATSLSPPQAAIVGRSQVPNLYLPRRMDHRTQTVNSALLDVGAAMEIRMALATTVGTGNTQTLISKYSSVGGNRSYQVYLSSGYLRFVSSDNGVNTSDQATTIALYQAGITDFAPVWLRITYRQSDNRIQFFTAPYVNSDDPATWVQIGGNATATRTGIYNGIASLSIGARTGGDVPAFGAIYRAQVWNGIEGAGGALVWDADFTKQPDGTTSFVEDASGLTVTVNGSARICNRTSA